MSREDRDYYAERMRQELATAATCEDNAAARVHLDLAALYQRRAEEIARVVSDTSPVAPRLAPASPDS